MKKILGGLLALIAVIMFVGPSAHAQGAITADEQRIMDELNQGVMVGGKSFYFPASEIAQAENQLKQMDYSASEVNAVVAHIQHVRSMVESSGVDVSNINTMEELIKALPMDMKMQIKDALTEAATILGMTITFHPGGFTLSQNGNMMNQGSDMNQGSTGSNGSMSHSNAPVMTSGDAIKQTGANYLGSAISFASLLLVAAGAVVVGRKKVA